MVKIKTTIVVSVLAAVLGFLLGRLTVTSKTEAVVRESVKYIKSNTVIRDTVSKDKLIPYKVYVSDTVVRYLTEAVDTAAILEDYYRSRRYRLDFSNDTVGIFKVDAEVNQNKLVYASSFVRPITKVVEKETTAYKAPMVQFYGVLGTSLDLKANKVSLGVDLKQRYIIGVSGIKLNDNYNYTIDVGFKL